MHGGWVGRGRLAPLPTPLDQPPIHVQVHNKHSFNASLAIMDSWKIMVACHGLYMNNLHIRLKILTFYCICYCLAGDVQQTFDIKIVCSLKEINSKCIWQTSFHAHTYDHEWNH